MTAEQPQLTATTLASVLPLVLRQRDSIALLVPKGLGMYMQPLYLQWLRRDFNYLAEMLQQRGMIQQKFPIASGHSRPHGDPAPEAIDPGDVQRDAAERAKAEAAVANKHGASAVLHVPHAARWRSMQ